MKPNVPRKAPVITLLLCPIRAHERDRADEIIVATRALYHELPATEKTEIIRGRLLPAKVPIRARLVALDAGRLGPLPDALRLIESVLDRGGEVICRDFRLVGSDPDYPTKASVLVFLALIRREYRSARVREGLHFTRERNGGCVSLNRKSISGDHQTAIRATYSETRSLSITAKKHGVSKTTVHRCVRRKREE